MKNILNWLQNNAFALLSALSSLLSLWNSVVSIVIVCVFGVLALVQSSRRAKSAQKQIDELKKQIEAKANKPRVDGETLVFD